MGNYTVISSDSHVFEPPDLWTSRTEPKFKDRAPHVIHRSEDDTDWWVCEGMKGVSGGSGGSQAGKRFDAPETLTMADKMENVRPGGYIPGAPQGHGVRWSGGQYRVSESGLIAV